MKLEVMISRRSKPNFKFQLVFKAVTDTDLPVRGGGGGGGKKKYFLGLWASVWSGNKVGPTCPSPGSFIVNHTG